MQKSRPNRFELTYTLSCIWSCYDLDIWPLTLKAFSAISVSGSRDDKPVVLARFIEIPPRTRNGDIASRATFFIDLAMTYVTFDLWLWKPFQKWQLTRWSVDHLCLVSLKVETSPVDEKKSRLAKLVSTHADTTTHSAQTAGRLDGRPEYMNFCCYWLKIHQKWRC